MPDSPSTSAASEPRWPKIVDELVAKDRAGELAYTLVDRPMVEAALAEKHQAHYRSCGCLGGSSTCCDLECICHVLD